MKTVVLYGSSRANGNTELLVKHGLNGQAYEEVFLHDYRIEPIDDRRHHEGGFIAVDDDYETIIAQVLAAERLVFATPIYWYGMSGQMKNFVDRFSQSLRNPQYAFKQQMATKNAYVVLVGGDQARVKGLPLIQQFNYIFQFLGTTFAGYVIGEANAPNEILTDVRALTDCQTMFAPQR